jgi:hypothetical protein
MQGQAKPKAADDPSDFVVIPADQVRVAPSDAEISDLLRAAARHQSESGARTAPDSSDRSAVPAVDTRFRATVVNDGVPARGRTFGRQVIRAMTALLLAIGIGAAALTWQTFGYAARKAVFKWAPSWAITASLPLGNLGLSAESAASDEAADATPAQVAAPAQSAVENNAPPDAAVNAAAASPDAAQQLQSMARDLANANQQVETLKASLAELKASQQQMAHELAKVSEQNAKPKIAAVPPRPPVAARKPAAVYSPASAAPLPGYRPSPAYSAQASVPPAAPQPYVPPPVQVQQQTDPGMPATAPRPPMPVRAPIPEQ